MTTLSVGQLLADRSATRNGDAPLIVALIPAHNEEDGIVKTVASLYDQTVRPDLVIVMADNCTDETVPRASKAGAWVIETVDNTAKKAGALNQGLETVLPFLADTDFVICQDADGELAPDFVAEALATFPMVAKIGLRLGGLSGAVTARPTHNACESAQAVEYARGTRMMSRHGGKVHVLSGAAALFPVEALRRVAEARSTLLPGVRGAVFMEDSLTEDYELTLAIKKLGYHCTSTKRCKVVTDVMPTWHDLHVQRLRWFRGAMESLWLYGWSRLTQRIWIGVFWTFFVSLLFPLSVIVLVASYYMFGHHMPDFRYLIFFPLFAAEGIVVARRLGWRERTMAAMFVPLWLFDNLMFFIYWQALFAALRNKARIWIT